MEHDEEDVLALEAALAFLDGWEVTGVSCESSSECSRGGCGSSASFASLGVEISRETAGFKFKSKSTSKSKRTSKSASKPASKPKSKRTSKSASNSNLKRQSTTDRRKEEILQLRAELNELEEKAGQLYETKELQKRVNACGFGMSGELALGLAKEKLAAAWEEVVVRQKRLRIASEMENARLINDVMEQRKTIASIKTELRRLAKVMSAVHDSPIAPAILMSMEERAADVNLALDKTCRQMETVFFGKANGDVTAVCRWLKLAPSNQIVKVSPTKLVAMVHHTRILPFDFFQVTSVMPENLDASCQPPYKLTDMTTNNTKFSSYFMEHQSESFSYSLCTNAAMRQPFSAGYVGFVFASVSHPFVINGSSAPGISLSNRSFTSFTKLSDTSSDVAMCQIDVAIQIEVETSATARAERKAQAWNLAEAVIKSDREHFNNFVGRIESAVLQRQMGISRC